VHFCLYRERRCSGRGCRWIKCTGKLWR